MAQLAVRRVGGLRKLSGARLGAATPNPDTRYFEAVALVGGGVLGAAGLVLFAKGYSTEAYALGAAGALLGGTIAAIKLLSTPAPTSTS